MNKSDLQTALLILPEDYRQNAFEFLTEHADYTPEDFIDFIKDQLDQMQRAYEYELQDKDDEIASLQNDYEASEYGYDDLQDDFEDLKDALDKAGVYVELKQPSCLSRKELMNFYSRS